jgi:adenylate cyclase
MPAVIHERAARPRSARRVPEPSEMHVAARSRSVVLGHNWSVSEAGELAFFEALETHRVRAFVRLMRHLPSDPRCAVCRAPFGGPIGRVMSGFGFGPSRKNPRLCSTCFEHAPMGGVEMDVGILFADIRGFTSLAEHATPDSVATLLNRFYAAAIDILCKRAIIDKLVGDQVMALYLPRVFPGEPVGHMIADARLLLAAAGYADQRPWVQLGIGLDFGTAYVGNVGAGEVKDFTAIGDVVNTAARLQAAAASGEIVMSGRVSARAGALVAGALPRELSLKGKSEPEIALVSTYQVPARPPL